MKDQLNDIKKPLDGILGTVGQTPLIQLHRLFDKLPIEVYAKLEAFNPGGSIKDRTALSILKKAFKTGKLTRKTTIIESSSGNMAIGLAQACLYLGLNLIVVVDPNVNPHTLHILQTYGAKIEKVTKPSTDGGFLGARLDRVKELMASTPNSFWPNQYCNKANPKAHTQTMQEILAQMNGQLDYVLVATSTCGTLMGCAEYVRKHGLATKIVAVDAVGSVIFGDSPKKRLIPGHGAGRPSQLLNPEYVDQHIHISDEECVLGCHRLLHREAILAGGSSGALVMALNKIAPQIPAESKVALILCDRGERYLQTIYSPKWIRHHFGDVLLSACKRRNFSAPEDSNPAVESKRAVAIIGGGPKGLYGMEALTRELRRHPPKYPVEIHIFNRTSHFGAGDVYRPDQPPYWLMNYAAGNIDMWPRNTGEETTDRETFLQWLRKKNVQVDETTVVPRAQVGQYLMDGFLKIINSLPEQVSVKPHVGEVKHIEDHNGGYRVTYTCDEQKTQEVDVTFSNVLLSTGHPRPPVSQYASSQFIPFIYPVENLSRIPAASSVALKGMGLTAIDAILALTEGRGGKFTNNNSNELVYEASGKEPKCIYPYSRSGAPMLPRQHLKTEQQAPLKFLNEKQFAQWQQQEEVDFLQDVWPVLEQEMVYQYYQGLVQKTAFHQQLQYSTDTNIYQLVRDFHKHDPQQPVFTAEALLFPFKNSPTAHSQSFHRMVIEHLQHSIAAAQRAAVPSPLMTAASVWRRVAPQFRQLFLQPGLSVNSHQRFDQEYRSALNRIAYGPPLVNAQKLLALAKANMVNFAFAKNPETNYSIDDQQFQIKSLQQKVTVDYLIDARIPPHSIDKYPPDLYAQMINSGLIRPYKRQGKGGRSYVPGCMDLDVETGQIIDQNGQKNVFITAMGIPTEGVTFDNDSLSRTCNDYISNWAKQVVQSLQKSKQQMKQAVSKKKTKHYPLTPIRATWINELLANRHLLFDAVNQFSSPINIHHAGPFQENYQEFHHLFQKHHLKHEIFFARKANKSRVFVREAKRLGFGVDTASFRELQESLKMGCSPDKLVVTAAIKTPELIQLALQKEVLLILDNEDEARAVNAIAESLGKTPKIGIRISGFKYKGLKLYSRFGFDIEQALNFIVQNIGPQKTFSQLRFAGLHFHLNGYSTDERGTALLATIKLADALQEASYKTEFIDMGGGILINYLKSEEEWKNFIQALGEAVQGNIDPITFRNNGLGMELIDGQLYGQPSVYPYFNKTPRIPFLEAVLARKNEDNLTASQLLRDRGIEIRIEPGRSLLDQTGMTVARVVYRKYDAQGQLLVGLQMNRTQMFSSSADFLLDPVMLYQTNHQNPKGSIPVYFVGAYCLEQDVILKRQIHLPAVPEIGDLVCFFNTAGYMMHFYETEAHLFDLATNLVAHKNEDLSVPYLFNKDQ